MECMSACQGVLRTMKKRRMHYKHLLYITYFEYVLMSYYVFDFSSTFKITPGLARYK